MPDWGAICSKFLTLTIAGVLLLSGVDYMRLLGYEWGPGWDFKCNCDAAYTLFNGGNPYRSHDYSFIRNAFTYLPFWLPVHGVLCKLLNVTDIKTTIIYYPVYVGLFLAVLYFAAIKSFLSRFDRLLFATIVLGGLNGFLWLARTGNIALFETVFFLAAVVSLHGYSRTNDTLWLRSFAILFGAFMSVKSATLAFAPLLLLLPAPRKQRLEAAAIALCIGCVPIAVSYIAYPELMPQYFLMLANKIEGNVNPHICSPSSYCFFRDIVLLPANLSVPPNVVRALSLGASALLLGAATLYAMGRENRSALVAVALRGRAPRPRFAFNGDALDLFLLCFAFIQLLMPRFKEYTFALLSVALAFLILRLVGTRREKVLLATYLLLPIIDFAELVNSEDSKHFAYYLQLFVGLSAFLYLVVRYCARPAVAAREGEQSEVVDTPVAAKAGLLSIAQYAAIPASVLIGIAIWATSEPFHGGSDAFRRIYPANDFFRAYYAAARALWGDMDRFRELIANYDFVNLPAVALLFAPMGLVEMHWAAVIHLAAGLASCGLVLLMLARLAGKPRRALLVLTCLFLVNGPLIYSFKEGNTTHFLLPMIVGAILLLQQRRTDHIGGAILGVAAVLKPPLLLLGIYFALRRRWRVVVGGACVVLASIALSIAVFGVDLNLLWLRNCILPFVGRPVHAFNVQSLDGLLIRWHLGSEFVHGWGPNDLPTPYAVMRWLMIGGLISIAALAMRHPNADCEMADAATVITLAVVISPLSWTHYYALLLVPWGLYVCGHFKSDRISRWLMIGGVILASLPVTHIPLHGSWRETVLWHLLSSMWLLGGLLTLAALLNCRRLAMDGATRRLRAADTIIDVQSWARRSVLP